MKKPWSLGIELLLYHSPGGATASARHESSFAHYDQSIALWLHTPRAPWRLSWSGSSWRRQHHLPSVPSSWGNMVSLWIESCMIHSALIEFIGPLPQARPAWPLSRLWFAKHASFALGWLEDYHKILFRALKLSHSTYLWNACLDPLRQLILVLMRVHIIDSFPARGWRALCPHCIIRTHMRYDAESVLPTGPAILHS